MRSEPKATGAEGSPAAGTTDTKSRVTGAGTVAIALGLMNVANYGFTILAARFLGPQPYGAFAALMGLLLVVNVLALGLQATAARRLSANPDHAAEIDPIVKRVSLRSGLALGAAFLLAAPVINWALHLESLPTAALVGVAAVPLTLMGGQAGILQGERRWVPLAAIYFTSGVGRLIFGFAMVAIRPSEFAAMLGVAIGAWLPVVIGAILLRRPRPDVPDPDESGASGLLSETMHNSHALLAFFAMSNIDIIMARALFDAHEAGLYAAGLILTKAVLFLPQFVVVVAFPSMADKSRPRAYLQGLAGVLFVGGVATLGAAVLSPLALAFVGGPEYAEIQDWLWAFAGVGTLLAMLQLMVYEVVARQRRTSVWVLWGCFATIAGVAALLGAYVHLLAVVALIDIIALAALLAEAQWTTRSEVAGRRSSERA